MRIGVSGWRYAPWRGRFYPRGLPQHEELRYSSEQLATVELNGTFYALQSPTSFATWHDATPRDFKFAVKGGRFITHMKRLRDVTAPLSNFFASGVLRLESKLGPFLWQLPGGFRFDAGRIERFLALLPHDTEAAVGLARRHDAWMRSRAWLEPSTHRRLQHALELRHESFLCTEMIDLARHHGIALVFSHTAGVWPYTEEITSDFVYVRLHGPGRLYASDYDENARAYWAERIRTWRTGAQPDDAKTFSERAPPRRKRRDVWVFFDNTDKVHAPGNALAMARALAEA